MMPVYDQQAQKFVAFDTTVAPYVRYEVSPQGQFINVGGTPGSGLFQDFACFDAVAGKTLIFGSGRVAEIAAGALTAQYTPIVSPPPGEWINKIYWDSNRRKAVLLRLNEAQPAIWEFDVVLRAWFQRNVVPPGFVPRNGFACGYHQATGLGVIFGGQDSQGLRGDTWHYDGVGMTQAVLGSQPASRIGARMAYRAVSQDLVLWGGSNGNQLLDTWSYTPSTVAVSYATVGAGCVGSAGIPTLQAALNSLPFAGQNFVVNVQSMPWTSLAFMALGFSSTSWNGAPLPIDLTSLGMSGCSIRVSVDNVFPISNVLGVGVWSIGIPSGFGGGTFYNQAIVFDAAANAFGATMSNAKRAIVGY
jgi:hypothetical protein